MEDKEDLIFPTGQRPSDLKPKRKWIAVATAILVFFLALGWFLKKRGLFPFRGGQAAQRADGRETERERIADSSARRQDPYQNAVQPNVPALEGVQKTLKVINEINRINRSNRPSSTPPAE